MAPHRLSVVIKMGSYDAGNHTCVVTDDFGNIEWTTKRMNVIGKSALSQSVPLLHRNINLNGFSTQRCTRNE